MDIVVEVAEELKYKNYSSKLIKFAVDILSMSLYREENSKRILEMIQNNKSEEYIHDELQEILDDIAENREEIKAKLRRLLKILPIEKYLPEVSGYAFRIVLMSRKPNEILDKIEVLANKNISNDEMDTELQKMHDEIVLG